MSSRCAVVVRTILNVFDFCVALLIGGGAVLLGLMIAGATAGSGGPFVLLGLLLAVLGVTLLAMVCSRLGVATPPAAAEPICTACGYPTRGLVERRCPECGTELPDGVMSKSMPTKGQFPVPDTGS